MTTDHAERRAPTAPSDDRRRELAARALVAAALLLPLWGLLRYQGPPMEEGFMLAFPEQLLDGRLPHRDFLHLYGPGSLWVLAGIYQVFGVTLTVERLVGFAQHATVAFAIYALVRPWGRRLAVPAAWTSIVILISPLGLSAMAWNGALAAGLAGLAVGTAASRSPDGTRSRRLCVVAGVLAGVSVLYRPDLVLAVVAGFGLLAVGLDRARRLRLVAAGAATAALYLVHVALVGLGPAVEGMFVEPVFELRGGRSLPVPPSWSEVDGFLQRAGSLRSVGWPLPMLGVSRQIHLWFWLVPVSIVVVLAGAWVLRRRDPGGDRALTLWPAAWFGAALLPQALQRPDTAHLSWVTGVTFALAIPASFELWGGVRPQWSPSRRRGLALAGVAAVLVLVIPFYPVRTYADLVGQTFGQNRFGFEISRGERTFYFGDEGGAADAQEVVDRLAAEARAGERLIVGPVDLSRTNYSDAFFYYLFPELVPGTRYIEMDPGIADADDSGLAEELRQGDWLILSDAWSEWDEPNDSGEAGSDEPNRVVAEEYCPVLETPTFRLLRRCDAAPT